MKKLLAILLALMMVLVSVAALADDANILGNQGEGATATYTKEGDVNNGKIIGIKSAPLVVTINKAYTVTGSTAVMPEHKLTFTVTQDEVLESTSGDFPDGKVTIDPVEVDAETKTGTVLDLKINLPSYTEPGIYIYNFTEDNGTAHDGTALTNPHAVAGVQYLTKTYELKVYVIEGSSLAAGGITGVSGLVIGSVALREKDTTDKIDTITNEYIAGSLTIDKQVTGNMGDQKRLFDFTVTFTTGNNVYVDAPITYTITRANATAVPAEEETSGGTVETGKIDKGLTGTSSPVTFQLAHGDKITFANLPKGISYKIEEASVTGYDTNVTTGNAEATITSADEVKVTFTNDKNIIIDTGVTLDNAVYMLIMALAVAGFVALKIRRREDY